MYLFRPLTLLPFLLLTAQLCSQNLRLPESARPASEQLQCGGMEVQRLLFDHHPERANKQAVLDDQLYQLAAAARPAAQKSAAPYTLPVVFHIIHNNGLENLPDDRILAALDQVNDAFAHAGYFSTAGDGFDTGIRFCLARRTPEGLATTGITRTESSLTSFTMETQDLALKDLARWDPTKYINIWIVADINSLSQGAGVAGYAFLPSSHGEAEDGIVCEASFLGANPSGNAVLIHELGHYLGLYHTFQGGCPNADCLLDGDRVCDTPPDQAQHSVCPFNSCTTDADAPAPNPFSTDVDDPTSNFLDYSALECYAGFSVGQSVRMADAIEIARASLLESDACLDPCTQPIACAFSIDPPVAVPGQQVQFNNLTTGATDYWWLINGGVLNPLENPTHTFAQPGLYLIELQASNNDPNCSGSFSLYYTVECPVHAGFSASQVLVQPGSTVIFTDTSSGATSLQWLINGLPTSTAQVFSHTFTEAGIYTVVLNAGNGLCTDQAAIAIRVEAPCTGLMETGLYSSTDPVYDEILIHRNIFTQSGDIAAAGVLIGQVTTYKGVVAKWNSAAQIQWAKSTPGRYFHNIVEAPDGNWVLYAVGSPCVVAKIKPDGTVLWAKSFPMPSTAYTILSYDHITVLPNGDIAFVFLTDNNGEFLFRTDADGNLLWQRSFISFGGCNLSPAIDGSNNLRAISYGDNYLLFAPDGQLLEVKKPVFATNPTLGEAASFEKYNPHPDGSFSIWVRTQSTFFGQGVVLYHFNPAGVLQWSRSFDNSSGQYFVRYYPGDGWLVTFNIDLKHILYRLNEDSSIRWSKEFTGGGPAYVFTGFSGLAESPDGRVAGLNNLPYYPSSYLVVFDPNAADNCNLVNYAPGQTFSPLVSWQNDSHPVNVSNIPVADFNLVFNDIALDFEPQCTAPANCPEICDNGIDDDADGLTDCADTDCQCGPNNVCVPDAVATLDSVVCETTCLKVFLRICNTGGVDVPAGTPLQFYLGDPVNSPAATLGQAFYLSKKIAPNSCENETIILPMPPNGTIFGMLNDNGSLPTPFDPDQDFPDNGLVECAYANNLFSFALNFNQPTLDLGPDLLLCNSSVVPLHGGNGFARYRWADGSTDSVFTAYGPGTYWLDAWDACGNLSTDTVHIALQTAIPLDLGPDQTLCPGDSLALSATGFEQVSWAPAGAFSCADCPLTLVVADSAMTVRVTGRTGSCFVSDSLRVLISMPPEVTALVVPSGCSGLEGKIELTTTGGAMPLTFEWSDGGLGTVRDSLAPGDYFVEITDANGCSLVDTFSILQGSQLQIQTLNLLNVNCYGDETGQISIAVQQGIPPYQLNWSNGATGPDLSGLAAGQYLLDLVDSAGCTLQQSFEISQPDPLMLSANLVADTCGQQTGAIFTQTTGGTSPYQWSWSNGAATPDLHDLPSGSLGLSLVDHNGCLVQQNFEVPAVEVPVDFALQGGTITCFSPTVPLTAQPADFVFQWQTPQGLPLTGPVQVVGAAGQYHVTATNSFGCSAMQQIEVLIDTVAPLAVAQPESVLIPCDQSPALLDGSGSAAPGVSLFWEKWDNGQWVAAGSAPTLDIVQPGFYRLQAFDTGNGCSAYDTVQAGLSAGIEALWLSVDSVSCFGGTDGQIRVDSVSGGQAAFEYSLNNQAFTSETTFSGLPPGEYILAVRDADGCLLFDTVSVFEPAPLGLSLHASANPVSAGELFTLTANVALPGVVFSAIHWMPADLFPVQDQLVQTLDLSDTTWLQVSVLTDAGCADSVWLRVDVRPGGGAVYQPTAFLPGRSGNGVFTIYGGPELQQIDLLRIYNRWGALVFENSNFPPNDPAYGWDGRFRGRDLPAGVYAYHLELRFSNGEKQVLKGEVTLVR